MMTCTTCGQRHADLARTPGDDPGCNWDVLAGNPPDHRTRRENLEDIADAAARLYRNSEPASDTSALALLVINLTEVITAGLPAEFANPWHGDER